MGLIFSYKNFKQIAGADEAGRGCLAGPVVAAAVILQRPIAALNDSKQLSEKQRMELKEVILDNALSYKVVFIGPRIIEKINILNASIQAMQEAISALKPKPEIALIDGNRFKPMDNGIPFETIVKGDGKFQSIAAASILAKTYRDEYMKELALKFSYYGWETNAGYPTKKHREGIASYGPCEHHRKTFQLLPAQLKLL